MKDSDNYMNQWIDVSENESGRIYHYPGGASIRVNNVVKFHAKVSYAGNGVAHRLVTKDNRRFYIQPGWLALEIEGFFFEENQEGQES